jgi:hypothetical protein
MLGQERARFWQAINGRIGSGKDLPLFELILG